MQWHYFLSNERDRIAGTSDSETTAQMGCAEEDDVIEAFLRIQPISFPACPLCQRDRGKLKEVSEV
jgi:hypothetical protein